MRAALFPVLFVIITIFFSTICFLFGAIKRENAAHRAECWWAFCALKLAGVKIEADLGALKPGVQYIFISNHQSNFDIPVLLYALRGYNVRLVAKESLFRIPLFGSAMKKTGHIEIDRENRVKSVRALEEAVKASQRGRSILVFPEGSRNLDQEKLGEFKPGGMIIALRSSLELAPLVISGTAEVLSKGSMKAKSGVVKVKALPPFDPQKSYSLREREKMSQDLWLSMNKVYGEMHS